MLDIKLIRENPDKINELLKRRNPELSIDEVIEIDVERRKIQTQADELRAKRKSESQKIGELKKQGQDTTKVQEEVREIGDKIKVLEEKETEGFKNSPERERRLPQRLPHLRRIQAAVSIQISPRPEYRFNPRFRKGYRHAGSLGAKIVLHTAQQMIVQILAKVIPGLFTHFGKRCQIILNEPKKFRLYPYVLQLRLQLNRQILRGRNAIFQVRVG